MCNQFVALFKRYDWTVEKLGDNSFIAYNNIYFVPFSCVPCAHEPNKWISAVSYHITDKELFIQEWQRSNKRMITPTPIGHFAFANYINNGGLRSKFIHIGAIANHDHSAYEIECWLERIHK